MNIFSQHLMKGFTNSFINVKKHYRLYRRLTNALHPHCQLKTKYLDSFIRTNEQKIPIRIFYPPQDAPQKALLYFHGGGWIAGNISSYTKICADLAKAIKHIVVLIEYRLAPENPFPAGVEDCYHAAKELFSNPDILHIPKSAITLIGDSAGGNLAAAVSLMAKDRDEFAPHKQILIYPPTHYDHSENSPYPSVNQNGHKYLLSAKRINDYMDLYMPQEEERNNPYLAPIIASDLSDQPKSLIITAAFDPLRDEGEAFGQRLKDFDNKVTVHRIEDSFHGFLTFPRKAKCLPEAYAVINDFLLNE